MNKSKVHEDKTIVELRKHRTPTVEFCERYPGTEKTKTGKVVDVILGPCKRIDGNLCNACLSPEIKWKLGMCNLATHASIINETSGEKVRAGQQKQKKHR